MSDLARQAKLWAQKWRWYQRNGRPWNRARIDWHLMRREAFARYEESGLCQPRRASCTIFVHVSSPSAERGNT